MTEELETARLQMEINELKKELAEYKQIVKDLSVPIIPSIVPETILVPITGKLSHERFEMIISKLLTSCYEQEVETVIMDFTAISKNEIVETGILGQSIDNLVSSLQLMGVDTFLVGFTPSFTHELSRTGLKVNKELNTFLTFRSAIQFLMKKKNMSLV
ncbi:STAS domain-containing protein [Domibacillus antri]|nr:STAS domain-containing protein [Domibacillus antri]